MIHHHPWMGGGGGSGQLTVLSASPRVASSVFVGVDGQIDLSIDVDDHDDDDVVGCTCKSFCGLFAGPVRACLRVAMLTYSVYVATPFGISASLVLLFIFPSPMDGFGLF